MDKNPDRQEAHRLRGWFDERGGNLSVNSLSQSSYRGGGEGGGRQDAALKTLGQIRDEYLGHAKVCTNIMCVCVCVCACVRVSHLLYLPW
jgi:hypothetical protein